MKGFGSYDLISCGIEMWTTDVWCQALIIFQPKTIQTIARELKTAWKYYDSRLGREYHLRATKHMQSHLIIWLNLKHHFCPDHFSTLNTNGRGNPAQISFSAELKTLQMFKSICWNNLFMLLYTVVVILTLILDVCV